MTRTYYIVRFQNGEDHPYWKAYRKSILTFFNLWSVIEGETQTLTLGGPDKCEELLRKEVVSPRIVRTIMIPSMTKTHELHDHSWWDVK